MGQPNSSLIDFQSGYDQKMLQEDRQDYMASKTTEGMYRVTKVVLGATNSVSAFVSVSRKILNSHLVSIWEIFIDHLGVKGRKSRYGEEEVEGPPGVRWFLMEYLQNLDNILADVKRPGATISCGKPDWCWNGVNIVRFVCGEVGRWPQASKLDKVWNLAWCESHTECRASVGLCAY